MLGENLEIQPVSIFWLYDNYGFIRTTCFIVFCCFTFIIKVSHDYYRKASHAKTELNKSPVIITTPGVDDFC